MSDADLLIALDHLRSGDWAAAHELVQEDAGSLAAWAHGIVHRMEGDDANADYWYRRAARTPLRDGGSADAIRAEIDALAEAMNLRASEVPGPSNSPT